MSGLRSGQLADAAGVNPQTLRYYERIGLLAEPERTLGGHRLYPPEASLCCGWSRPRSAWGSPWTRWPTCWRPAATGMATAHRRG
ncbi:MerR family DNA-binding transcriptional regulator [Actinosynnema sp. CA-299493]